MSSTSFPTVRFRFANARRLLLSSSLKIYCEHKNKLNSKWTKDNLASDLSFKYHGPLIMADHTIWVIALANLPHCIVGHHRSARLHKSNSCYFALHPCLVVDQLGMPAVSAPQWPISKQYNEIYSSLLLCMHVTKSIQLWMIPGMFALFLPSILSSPTFR